MVQAVEAYRHVSAMDEFLEFERVREKVRLNEASALANARRQEREIWQGKMAKKDAENAKLLALLAKHNITVEYL